MWSRFGLTAAAVEREGGEKARKGGDTRPVHPWPDGRGGGEGEGSQSRFTDGITCVARCPQLAA